MVRPATEETDGPGEAQFRALAETTPDAIVTGDVANAITYVNPAAERLFGYRSADMVGRSLSLLMPDRLRDAHHAAYARYVETGKGELIGTTLEVIGLRADGSEFPIELSLGSAGAADDRTLFAVIRDLTVRQRRERHLAAQLAVTAVLAEPHSAAETGARIVEQLTRALGWDVGILWLREGDGLLRVRHVWQADPAATAAFARASEALTLAEGDGLPGSALAGRSPVWLEDIAEASDFRRAEPARASGLRGAVCLPLLTDDGGMGALECFTCEKAPGDDDLRDLLMTVASQAGEHLRRRAAEEHLDEARTRFTNAFVHAPIGMALLDAHGRWSDVNPALCRITGRAREALLSRAVEEVVHPEDRPALAAFLERALRDEPGEDVELRVAREDADAVWVRVGLSLVRQHGERYLIAQIQDVTAARHVAELRERTAVELQRSNAELEAFAHIAAHDLRTPLQTITGFAKLLQRRYGPGLDAEGRDFVRMVLESAESSNALLAKLLSYARAGGAAVERVAVDPRVVLEQVLVGLGAEIDAREARVTIAELPAVMADPVQLAQVLQNLLANAIKFTPRERRPEVEVTGTGAGDMVRLSVADRGIGVAPEEAGEVFGMFRRGASGVRYEGSGIGLAVAAKVVAAHGGRLWVDARPGGGSVFSLTLPAASSGG
jgi:PAS domain S-box-containing protein